MLKWLTQRCEAPDWIGAVAEVDKTMFVVNGVQPARELTQVGLVRFAKVRQWTWKVYLPGHNFHDSVTSFPSRKAAIAAAEEWWKRKEKGNDAR